MLLRAIKQLALLLSIINLSLFSSGVSFAEIGNSDKCRLSIYYNKKRKVEKDSGAGLQKSEVIIPTDNISYPNLYQIVIDQLKQGCYPEKINFLPTESFQKSYCDETDLKYYCKICKSKNGKYLGLSFTEKHMYYVLSKHFVLVDRNGNFLWEQKYDKIDWRNQQFVNDKSKVKVHHVLNNGSSLFTGNTFWNLYDLHGHILVSKNNKMLHSVVCNSKSRILISENLGDRKPIFSWDFGTSCYDFSGQLLWHNEIIRPLDGIGYIFSPSDERVIACKKDGYCMINLSGDILSSLSGLEKCDCEKFGNPKQITWGHDEDVIIHNHVSGYIRWKNFKIIKTFDQIENENITSYGKIEIHKVYPLTNGTYFFAGFREPGYDQWYHSKYNCRIFGILDRRFQINCVIRLLTNYESKPPFKIEINSDSIIVLSSNELTILNLSGKIRANNVFRLPSTPTPFPSPFPTPTRKPRPTPTPHPPRSPGGKTFLGDRLLLCSAIYYGTSDDAEVFLVEPNGNTDSTQVESCIVWITSDTDPEGIKFTLKEISVGSPYFVGHLHFSFDDSIDDDMIKVSHHDNIRVHYRDPVTGSQLTNSAVWYWVRYEPQYHPQTE